MSNYIELQQQTPGVRNKMEHDFSPQMSPLLNDDPQSFRPAPENKDFIQEINEQMQNIIIPPSTNDLINQIENLSQVTKIIDFKLLEELEDFSLTLLSDVSKDFKVLIHQILPNRTETDVKEFLMVFTILKSASELADQIFKEYASELNNTVLFKNYKYSDEIREKIKKNNRIMEKNMVFCIKNDLQNLAMYYFFRYLIIYIELSDLVGMSQYIALDDNLIKQSISFKAFDFLDFILKKTKKNFNQSASSTKRHASQHSRHSIVESFKSMVQNQMSFKSNEDFSPSSKREKKEQNTKNIKKKTEKKLDHEIIEEMLETNKLLMIVIENKREKTARKLLYHFFLKYLKDFLTPKTLYLALENDLFLFFKKYFDMFPFSRFNILDFNIIAKALQMIEGRDTFIHAIFLFSKINAISLSEIHVRSIIDKLEIMWNEKLYYFTYTLNPILVAVLICELCHKLSKIFANVKVRLGILAQNYLNLAVLIKRQIHDELFIKTIYVYKFYPSSLTLLQILYRNRSFYAPLLQSDLINELVSDLWYCDYYNTYNVFNTSSAFQNLKGNLIILENINTISLNQQSSPLTYSPSLKGASSLNTMSNNKVNPMSPELMSAAHLNPALIDENSLKLNALQQIDLRNPFHFIRKSTFFDYKFTNHIFSYFFWQKSPAYRVIVESIIYAVFFILIIQNCFELFRLRRIFEGFPRDILVLIDAFVGLSNGIAPPNELFVVMYPWMVQHNTTDPRVPLYYASLQPTFCSIMVMFVPEFSTECDIFDLAAEQFWAYADSFVILQSFFFFTLIGTCLELIYSYIINKRFQVTFKIFSDLVISFTSLYVLIIYYTRIYVKKLIVRDNMLENYIVVEEVMLVFTFLMWIKFFIYLKLTKTFGYVIKVIEIMVLDLMNFMVIFTIILMAFALILYDLLSESQAYFVTFADTIQSLLLITYGQVFYDGFTKNETLGSMLITIFSFISIIILLNLLVAMLNNTYKTIYERSNLENANIFYLNYLARKPDKYKSALISFAPPLNLYVLPFVPVLLMKKSSRLNHYICLIGFTMFVIVYISIYIASCVALIIPLCWGRYLLSIYFNVIKRKFSWKAVGLWFMWFFGGLVYLIYLLIWHDIFLFVRSIYNKSPYKDRLDEITIEEINLIKKTCIQLSTTKKFLTHNEFCNAIREELANLNKTTRKYQMIGNLSAANLNAGSNLSANLLKNSFFKIFSEQKDASNIPLPPSGRMNRNLEKRLKQNIEIDKMEVFSLIKQYAGVNGYIMLNRMIILLDMLKFCKKFHLVKTSKIKLWKLVSYVQIVDISAVEKAVLGILAKNMKSLEQYETVISNIEEPEKQSIDLKEDNINVAHSKSFMNEMIKASVSLKKKATELESEEKRQQGFDSDKTDNGFNRNK